MECRELTALFVDRLAGEIEEPVARELEEHLASCAACREEARQIGRAWAALEDGEAPEVTPAFRERTLALLEDEMLRSRIREFRPRHRWPRLVAQAAAVLVACAAGFFAARRGLFDASAPAAPVAKASPEAFLRDNPRLANVAYRTGADGRVEVGFDVTDRKTITGRPNDPEMAKLLAYLLTRNAETDGEKSRAIELVSEHHSPGTPASPDIISALTATLKKDSNPGVRKKAADALASFSSTPEIRTAFLDALRADPNPAVRLTAIEALAATAKDTPDQKTIDSLREKAQDPAENGFVRARAASALKNF